MNHHYDLKQFLMTNEELNVFFHSIKDLIIFKDGSGRWIAANNYTLTLFGLENIPYNGKTSKELAQITPNHQYRDVLLSRHDADEEAWTSQKLLRSEVEFPLKDGRPVILDVITTPIFNADGSRKALVVIGHDITERKKIEEQNYQLAYYDQLTKLPNRYMLVKELENQLIVANVLQQELVVMFLDMDRFKYINDYLGLELGDHLLIQISARLKQCMQEDWFLAHMGGDEFAILVPNVNMQNSTDIAQKIIDRIDRSFFVNEYELFLTTSIGLCVFPSDGTDAQTLMKNADIALNLAKEKGKNRYQVYNSKMDITTYKTFSLENGLNKAMTMDEFEMYYQPKIELGTNRIIGAEALIRWNHPEWGLVSPNEFISLAEETGLIVPMGKWIKQTVCKQNKEWQNEGIHIVPIAINLSAKRFMQKDFVEHILDILEETGLETSFLEVEITETSLPENEKLAISVINQLRAHGIKVSLDDFGTGYSALSYLKRFKVDTIKIDRSFIQEIGMNEQDELIVKGIIQLIHSLNINVIAEGVETEEQLQFLSEHNCQQVQGYIYSRPVRAEEFRQLLIDGKIDIKVQSNQIEQEIQNRRKYFRINFTYPLLADMTITKLNGKDISLGESEVLVMDIGLGGLCFASNIKMAVREDMILSFNTYLLGQQMDLIGRIVWMNEPWNEVYHYGVEFLIDESERESIALVINNLTVKLRRNQILPDCRFVMSDANTFFKKDKLT